MLKEFSKIEYKNKPELDHDFVPVVLWNYRYRQSLIEHGKQEKIIISIEDASGSIFSYPTEVFPNNDIYYNLNIKYIQGIIDSILWIIGGYKLTLSGNRKIFEHFKDKYLSEDNPNFESTFMGKNVYRKPFEVNYCSFEDAPTSNENYIKPSKNINGNRIGFDLGGTTKKCAAVVNGEIVFATSIPWDPRSQKDPEWFRNEIKDLLNKAAEKMPSVDCIGGSSAGVIIDNQPRGGLIFLNVPPNRFNTISNLFTDLKKEWKIPVAIVNDGEVTALAGAQTLNKNAILGVCMGTSFGGGYITPEGFLTGRLNEIGYVPIDYNEKAVIDEWSGCVGTGIKYFSIQAIARLAPLAKIDVSKCKSEHEISQLVLNLLKKNDKRAENIYITIGAYLAYAIAHYSEFYEFKNILPLGGVTLGKGGKLMIAETKRILKEDFKSIYNSIEFLDFNSSDNHKALAIAAASIPVI